MKVSFLDWIIGFVAAGLVLMFSVSDIHPSFMTPKIALTISAVTFMVVPFLLALLAWLFPGASRHK